MRNTVPVISRYFKKDSKLLSDLLQVTEFITSEDRALCPLSWHLASDSTPRGEAGERWWKEERKWRENKERGKIKGTKKTPSPSLGYIVWRVEDKCSRNFFISRSSDGALQYSKITLKAQPLSEASIQGRPLSSQPSELQSICQSLSLWRIPDPDTLSGQQILL